MQMQFTPNNKLASLGTIGLLFLAGIAGMVFLLPFNTAHAASATVKLSTISSGVETAATSGTVAQSGGLTITGTGFASNSPISITSLVGTTTITWFTTPSTCSGAFASAYGGVGTQNSLISGGCLTTTAIGTFKTTVSVPAMPGGAQTIVVSDGTNSVSSTFTINPTVKFATTSTTNFGFPEQSLTGSTIAVTGFGSGEQIIFTSSAFTGGFVSGTTTCTTGSTPGGSGAAAAGSCTTASGTYIIADQTGGAKTISAAGQTSGTVQTTTYTVKPWVAFYNTLPGLTTFSFLGTATLTPLYIDAHGMAATTIAANSITVGGVATGHPSVTPVSGAFVGLAVLPSGNVPFGLVSVVIGGTTFSYAAGNIASLASGTTVSYGGALISSVVGSGTSIGVANIDASSYKPGSVTASKTSPVPIQNQIGIFGYGFRAGGGTINVAQPSGVATWSVTYFSGSGTGTTGDANGAFYATALLGETPWSATATPTTVASYTPTVTQPTTGPASIQSPSFVITPWIGTISTTTVDYATATTVAVHGFGATDVVTATIGGAGFVTGGAGYGTCTAVSGACTTVSGTVPDLAAGKQNVAATGSVTATVVTSTGAVTYDPNITANGGNTAMNIVSGTGGQTTILRTGTNFGVHGLAANTAYSIVWNAAGSSTTIGTFTSTATGGIPVPGVQVTTPADISGIHIIDIQATATIGTSAIFAGTLVGDYSDSDSGLGATYTTQYGDMLFNEGTSLIATPTVASVGASVAVAGAGLASGTLYDLGVSQAGGGTAALSSSNPPNSCSLGASFPPAAPNTIVGSFTSTSTGAVPSGISVAVTDTPTYPGSEQGTLFCVFAQTATTFGGSTATGVAEYELQASANLNMTSAPIGHNVVESAHGLAAGKAYNILFAPYAISGTTGITGTVVGAILSSANGAGSGTFTIPATVQTASGPQSVNSGQGYSVQLQAIGSTATALAAPPTLTVGGLSGSCTNQGTSCMSLSGTPSVTKSGGNTLIQASFTNNSNAPQTAYIYAVVHNALGQTVYYTTATVSPAAGATQTGQLVLFGLAPGSYTATVFVVSTSGTALSTSSTVSVTI